MVSLNDLKRKGFVIYYVYRLSNRMSNITILFNCLVLNELIELFSTFYGAQNICFHNLISRDILQTVIFHAICFVVVTWVLEFSIGTFCKSIKTKSNYKGIRENQPKQCLSYSLRNKDGLFSGRRTMQRIHYTQKRIALAKLMGRN